MATVEHLYALGELFKLDPDLDHDIQEFRVFFASERLKLWIENTLPALGSSWDIETPPVEQFDSFMATYADGSQLTFGHQFKPIKPIGEGVWELKTADLRIFGWFVRQDCFIGYVADTTERIKRHGLYAGYKNETVHFRNGLALDMPKFVEGDDPNAVISNCDFAE